MYMSEPEGMVHVQIDEVEKMNLYSGIWSFKVTTKNVCTKDAFIIINIQINVIFKQQNNAHKKVFER